MNELEGIRDIGGELMQVTAAAPRTTAAYRDAVRGFLASGQPSTLQGFTAYIDSLRGVRSASTVNQAIAAGRKAFLQAAERSGCSAQGISLIRGSLAEVHSVRKAPPEVKTVTPAERALLFAALPLRVRLVAETLYITGARVSELLQARRDGIKVNGSVELRLYGKGGKQRAARIPKGLWERILAEYPTGTYLFETGPGKAFSRSYISREIARASRRVLGRAVSAHVLRHSRATDLLATTHRIKAVARLLGHASEATTLSFYVKDSFTDADLFTGLEE